MPHLYVSLSNHGFGHIMQTACVLNELTRQLPALQLTIQSGASAELLRQWINHPLEHQLRSTDLGMLMDSAVDVQTESSLAVYRDIHAHWDEHVNAEAERIRACAPDLLLSNISYLSLAAAAKAGIPSMALCSLNWADITAGYFHTADYPAMQQQMLDAYQSARQFLCPEPSMAMPQLDNVTPISPLARIGQTQRDKLAQTLNLAPDERVVIIGLGGIPTQLDMTAWPATPGTRWLIPDSWPLTHPQANHFSASGMAFIDMLASSDVLLTKPGYGSFAEAACNGIPVLYLRRQDWPEEAALVHWLQQHHRCQEISRQQLASGQVSNALKQLMLLPTKRRPIASGAKQAAERIVAEITPPYHGENG